MARRLVILTGTAQLNILVGNVSDYESTISNALVSAGFDVVVVRITKQTLFTNQINISIEINVDEQYTAEKARSNATAVLGSIAGESYAYYSSGLLSNVSLSVLKDGGTQTAASDTTNEDAVSKILKSLGQTTLDAGKGAVTGLASNIAVPLAIGAVIIVVLMKRK